MERRRFIFILLLLLTQWRSVVAEVILSAARGRLGQFRRKEDYSFESKLKRATEECSYIARTDDESHREELIQKIKNEMNSRKVEEFYQEAENEKRKSKEYYDNIERKERKKALEGHPPPLLKRPPGVGPPPGIARPPSRVRKFRTRPPPFPPPPGRRNRPPPGIDFRFPPEFMDVPEWNLGNREMFKRSPRSKDPSFTQGTFKDHNNCFSRCIFAGMELVDYLGFPNESLLRKALEDFVDDRRIRRSKIRRLHRCFDDIKKVAVDDNCIYAAKIFKCLGLDEPGAWI